VAVVLDGLPTLAERPWRVRAIEAARQLRDEQRTPDHTIVVSHEIALALADLIDEMRRYIDGPPPPPPPAPWFDMPVSSGDGVWIRTGWRWQPTEADHTQARINHGQTLEVLKSRGGLSWCELAAILTHRYWRRMSHDDAYAECVAELKRRGI
jgi:hypothetical protein